MLSSLGSLRRTKSSSSAFSRKSDASLSYPASSTNLSASNQRYAKTAAHLAYERYVDMAVPVSHQPERLEHPRRSTVDSSPHSRHMLRGSWSNGLNAAEKRSSFAENEEHVKTCHNRVESHQSPLLKHIPEEADIHGKSIRTTALNDRTHHVPPIEHLALRRSHSLLMTLRSSETTVSASRRSTIKAQSTVHAEGNSTTGTPFAPAILKRSKSLHSWRTSQRHPSTRPIPADLSNGGTWTEKANRLCVAGNSKTTAMPSAASAAAKENKLRRRTSFLSLPFMRRAAPISSIENTKVPNVTTESYPTTGRPRQLQASGTSMTDDKQARAPSAASSRRSSTLARQFKRYFSRKTRTAKQDLVASDSCDLRDREEQLRSMDPSSAVNPSEETIQQSPETSVEYIPDQIIQSNSDLEDPFQVAPSIEYNSTNKYASHLVALSQAMDERRSLSPAITLESCTSRSRVTSWTNSTITNTAEERLSVIAEDGGIQGVVDNAIAWASNFGAVKELSHTLGSQHTDGLFLNHLRDASDVAESKVVDHDFDEFDSRKPLSLSRTLSSWTNKPTIRSVQDQYVKKAMKARRGILHNDLPPVVDPSVPTIVRRKSVPLSALNTSFDEPLTLSPSSDIRAQRAAKANSRWTSPLVESQGLFFPRSPVSPARRFRSQRPLREKEGGSSSRSSGSDTPTKGGTGDLSQVTSSTSPLSPSVYSQASGFHPSPSKSSHDSHGFATIVSNRTYFANDSPRDSGLLSQRRVLSPTWTQWLDREVTELVGDVSDLSFEGFAEDAISSTPLGHKRESACILDPESFGERPAFASLSTTSAGSTCDIISAACFGNDVDHGIAVEDVEQYANVIPLAMASDPKTEMITLAQRPVDLLEQSFGVSPASADSETRSLRDYRFNERLRRRSLLQERSQLSKTTPTTPIPELHLNFTKTQGSNTQDSAHLGPASDLSSRVLSVQVLPKAQSDPAIDDDTVLRPVTAQSPSQTIETDQIGRQYVSKIPLAISTMSMELTRTPVLVQNLCKHKENAPRGHGLSPTVPKYVLTPRLSRAQSASPVISSTMNGTSPSPLRLSSMRNQTSGQIMVSKWLTGKVDPHVISPSDAKMIETDTVESTLVFI